MRMLNMMPMNKGRNSGMLWSGRNHLRGELLEFAHRHKMTMVNTLFPHRISRRTTWHSPDGVTHNQIDYIFSHHGDSSSSSTEPRAEHSREWISTVTTTWL